MKKTEQNMVVLQGKSFTIELQSMLGSTLYGWCLAKLPEGMILEGVDVVPSGCGTIAPVMQRFYFGVPSAEKTTAELKFVLANLSVPADIQAEHTVSLTIIQSDSEEFVKCTECANLKTAYAFIYNPGNIAQAAQAQMPYGMVIPRNFNFDACFPRMMYGVPFGFGLPNDLCNGPQSVMLYNYPSTDNLKPEKNEPFIHKKNEEE